MSSARASRGLMPPMRSAEHGFTPSMRSAELGFTLIEIMVALAVFSLAALALLRLEGATLRSAGSLDRTLLAGMVARNVAIEAVTDARPPALGLAQGSETEGGHAWAWTRTVAPLGDANVLRVEVSVADPRTRQVLGHATLVRAPTVSGAARCEGILAPISAASCL